MKFYIDFEATQFTNHIVSIGCVAENGETFQSLVRPLDMKKHKITNFITDLTGITKEMLQEAPDTNQAFYNFYIWWANNNCPNERPEFICYGNCDKNFVEATLRNVNDWYAVMGLSVIYANIKDYGPTVARHFGRSAVGLKRVYNLIKDENENQKHDALEDAEMLKYILENLDNVPADSVLPPAPTKFKSKLGPLSAIYAEWPTNGKKKFEANTLADETNYTYKCTTSMGNACKYFDSLETAALWIIKYLTPAGMSARRPEDIQRVIKNLERGLRKGIGSYGFKWEVKKEETEC